jgi:hypothetical protein
MDWEKVDLTLEGHIGGEDHPNMPWRLRTSRSGDLYMSLFSVNREGTLRIVRDDDELERLTASQKERDAQVEDNAANGFMLFFGRFPMWAKEKYGWLNSSIAGGDCCDRCGISLHVLNSSNTGCCDQCELEMNEQIAANPDVVFAFERGGLRAVA